MTLPNGLILVGHKLNKRTNKFLKILGEEENAQILDPKFYLAISLPNLSMNQFMDIASIPDEIQKEIINNSCILYFI